jgi:hypothetical protein
MQYNPTPNPSSLAERGNLAPISVYSRGGLGGEVSRMYFTQSGIAISSSLVVNLLKLIDISIKSIGTIYELSLLRVLGYRYLIFG